MKYKIFLIMLFFCVNSKIIANTNGYVALNAGMSSSYFTNNSATFNKKNSNEFAWSVGVGYSLYNYIDVPIRLEALLTQIKLKNEHTKNSINNYMLSVNYDFINYSEFLDSVGVTPYLGFGVGVTTNSVLNTDVNLKKELNNLALSLNVGTKIFINEQLSAEIGYKYINSGKYNFKNKAETQTFKGNLHHHLFMAGISYRF